MWAFLISFVAVLIPVTHHALSERGKEIGIAPWVSFYGTIAIVVVLMCDFCRRNYGTTGSNAITERERRLEELVAGYGIRRRRTRRRLQNFLDNMADSEGDSDDDNDDDNDDSDGGDGMPDERPESLKRD